MGKEPQHDRYPTGPKPLRLWASGIEVDIEFQKERVRNGCFCQGLTVNKYGRTEEYNMCPDAAKTCSRLACNIFRDQIRLKLPLNELACMGGTDPQDDEEITSIEDIEADFDVLDERVVNNLLYDEQYHTEGE